VTWQPIKTAPRDGTMFLALDLGYLPAFVRHHRPDKRFNRKRWLIVASQGAIFMVDDLAMRRMTKWMPLPEKLAERFHVKQRRAFLEGK
jgi:hypothetical protein